MFTSKSALALVAEASNYNKQKELSDMISLIESAAVIGNVSVSLRHYISEETIIELKNRGFEVKPFEIKYISYKNEMSLEAAKFDGYISWEEEKNDPI